MPKNRKGLHIKKSAKMTPLAQPGLGVKELHEQNYSEQAFEMEEKYVLPDGQPGENLRELHPNRNYNKQDIDKPAYS